MRHGYNFYNFSGQIGSFRLKFKLNVRIGMCRVISVSGIGLRDCGKRLAGFYYTFKAAVTNLVLYFYKLFASLTLYILRNLIVIVCRGSALSS